MIRKLKKMMGVIRPKKIRTLSPEAGRIEGSMRWEYTTYGKPRGNKRLNALAFDQYKGQIKDNFERTLRKGLKPTRIGVPRGASRGKHPPKMKVDPYKDPFLKEANKNDILYYGYGSLGFRAKNKQALVRGRKVKKNIYAKKPKTLRAI